MKRMFKGKNKRHAIVLLIIGITVFFSLFYYNSRGKDKTDSFESGVEVNEVEAGTLARPTLSQSTYMETGNTITPTINNYNPNYMKKTGQLSASQPGSYEIIITLTNPNNYTWSGGSTAPVHLTWHITERPKIAKPTLSQSTYMETGNTISPTINGYNSSTMSISGPTAAVNPGSYTITISLKYPEEYTWSDGSTSPVNLTWTIKARQRVSKPTLSQSTYMETGTYISPSLNGFSGSIMSKSGNTSEKDPGTYTLKIYLTDTANYTWSDGSTGPVNLTWTIKARTKLNKPTLPQSAFMETGDTITPTISGFDSNTMNKNGTISAKDPGSYNITISLKDPTNYAWSDGSTSPISLTWRINSRTRVTKPTLPQTSFVETGNTITPSVDGYIASLMTKSGTSSATAPGSYTIKFTLNDTTNYAWSDGSTSPISLTWKITARNKINKPTLPQTSFVETGNYITPTISGFDSNTMSKTGTLSAREPGSYTITISIKDTANYTWSDGSTAPISLTWKITARTKLNKPTLSKVTYLETGSTITPTINGFDTGTMTRSGQYNAVSPGSYTIIISLKNTTNYAWSDGSTDPVTLTWKIVEKNKLPMPTLSQSTFMETGSIITPDIRNFDGSTMEKSGALSAKDPGSYSITISIRDTTNYKWSDGSTSPIHLTWKITGKTRLATPTLSVSTFVETGDYITPTINEFNSGVMTKSGDVQAKNPGNYTITVSLKDPSNYAWSDGSTNPISLNWKITVVQQPVSVTKPTVIGSPYMETGSPISVSLKDFDNNIMNLSGNSSATNPGTYTINISLKNPSNYKWADGSTAPVTLSWKIKEKTKVTKPTLEINSYVETGGDITPAITGFDANTMSKTGDLTKKDPGSYTITVSLSDTANYKWADGSTSPVSLAWTITPAPVITKLDKPTLEKTEFDETGENITPTISGFDANTMSKTGDLTKKDPGTYTITVSLKNTDNYAWKDGSTSDVTLIWDIKEATGDVLGTLEFTVVNPSDNQPVSDVLVEVHRQDNDEVVYSGKTNNEGKVVVQGLAEGDYYVIEKEGTEDYEVNGEKKSFSISEDGGTVKLSNKKTNQENPKTALPSFKVLAFYGVILSIIGFVLYTLRNGKRIHRIS